MRISARNMLKGVIKSITPGVVDTEVVIEVAPGVEVAGIITQHSARSLDLNVGDTAHAIFKAHSVMVGKD